MKKLSLLLAAALLAGCATAPEPVDTAISADRANELARFAPRPSGSERTINYDVVDEFFDITVIDLGPSTRRKLRPPRAGSGTRVTKGHDSAIRLEGNKLVLSEFNSTARDAAREYAESLELIGNTVNIEEFPRNEQLAYWFNLHNVTLVSVLADRYPVTEPARMKVDGVLLHDAKLVEIDGVSLSLREIRQEIVYRHWDDPRVIYGFWHGDLASPSILKGAWSASRLEADLTKNAEEFVNSLRGVDGVGRRQLGVSPLYGQARDKLFPNWPTDLRAHLERHAFVPVRRLLNEDREITLLPYERRIADLAGGEPYPGPRPGVEALSGRNADSGSPAVREFVRELTYKFGDPTYWSRRRATVTILDGDDDGRDESDSAEIE